MGLYDGVVTRLSELLSVVMGSSIVLSGWRDMKGGGGGGGLRYQKGHPTSSSVGLQRL